VNADDRAQEQRRKLAAATAAAAAAAERAAPAPGEPPRPGDLYVFAATAAHDVEWLLTAAHPRRSERVRLVAADAAPWVGSADLEVPAGATATPLVLRCRHHLWWHRDDLPAGGRSGRLGADVAAAAEARCRALDAEGDAALLPGTSPLQQETDEDPEYRDREEELTAARAALAATADEHGRRRESERFGRRGPWSSVAALRTAAAVLLIALVATAWWASTLARRLDERSASSLQPIADAIVLEKQRGSVEAFAFDGPRKVFRLVSNDLDVDTGYRLEIVDEAGRTVMTAAFRLAKPSDLSLTLERTDFPPGRYLLRVFAVASTTPEPVHEVTLEVKAP